MCFHWKTILKILFIEKKFSSNRRRDIPLSSMSLCRWRVRTVVFERFLPSRIRTKKNWRQRLTFRSCLFPELSMYTVDYYASDMHSFILILLTSVYQSTDGDLRRRSKYFLFFHRRRNWNRCWKTERRKPPTRLPCSPEVMILYYMKSKPFAWIIIAIKCTRDGNFDEKAAGKSVK